MRDNRLNGFNLVGITSKEVRNQFGEPDSIIDDKLFYLRNNEILSLKIKNEEVSSFYWMKLNDRTQAIEALRKRILAPNPKDKHIEKKHNH